MPKKKAATKATSKNGRAWRPVPLSKKAQRERIEKLRREQGEKPPMLQVFENIQRDLKLTTEEHEEFMRILQQFRK